MLAPMISHLASEDNVEDEQRVRFGFLVPFIDQPSRLRETSNNLS